MLMTYIKKCGKYNDRKKIRQTNFSPCGKGKVYTVTASDLVMSNQRFLKIVCFRFPTNVPQKNRINLFLKQNSLSNQTVLFQI